MKRRHGGPRRPSRGTEELEGRATRFAKQGDAWVETASGTFAVPGAVPGDRVRVAPEPGGKPPRARLVAVLEPSPDRVDPSCPVVDRCGGCPMMTASPALERAAKISRVEAALHDVPVAPGLEVAWHPSPTSLGYRRRVRLAFSAGGAGKLGYHERRSARVLDVPGCPVLEAPLEAALGAIKARLLPSLRGEGEIRLGLGAGARPFASVHAGAVQPTEAYAAAATIVEEGGFAGLALFAGDAPAPALFGDPCETATGEDGLPMRAGLAGFSQANDAVNRALVREAVELAAPEGASVLELYAGAGNLTVALALLAARLVAVEVAPEAAGAARENLAARGLVAKLHCAKAEDAPRGRYDVVVLDPPRAGAGEAIARILDAKPARIVYVSCEPSTLGRDLRVLGAAGYRVDSAHAFDMFPHTAHVEALVRLVAT